MPSPTKRVSAWSCVSRNRALSRGAWSPRARSSGMPAASPATSTRAWASPLRSQTSTPSPRARAPRSRRRRGGARPCGRRPGMLRRDRRRRRPRRGPPPGTPRLRRPGARSRRRPPARRPCRPSRRRARSRRWRDRGRRARRAPPRSSGGRSARRGRRAPASCRAVSPSSASGLASRSAPVVSVPVLSKTTRFTLRARSRKLDRRTKRPAAAKPGLHELVRERRRDAERARARHDEHCRRDRERRATDRRSPPTRPRGRRRPSGGRPRRRPSRGAGTRASSARRRRPRSGARSSSRSGGRLEGRLRAQDPRLVAAGERPGWDDVAARELARPALAVDPVEREGRRLALEASRRPGRGRPAPRAARRPRAAPGTARSARARRAASARGARPRRRWRGARPGCARATRSCSQRPKSISVMKTSSVSKYAASDRRKR